MNKRRKLVIAFGAGALAPLAAFAQQQGKVWRVGFLAQRNRPVSLETGNYGAFLQGMREHGYVEDKNLVIEWRFTEGRAELLPVLAAELVRLKVDTIVTTSTPTAQAAQKATTTIPSSW
jgi:putative ABC transport system substrate-binding protein